PLSQVEYNLGDLPVGVDPDTVPLNGLSPEETVRRIAECRSWMVLKGVEQLPAYRALLDACLDPIGSKIVRGLDRVHDRKAFLFVSSPGSVTPFHMDNEHNFLLQVRGSKTMHLWREQDRTVLPAEVIENALHGPRP